MLVRSQIQLIKIERTNIFTAKFRPEQGFILCPLQCMQCSTRWAISLPGSWSIQYVGPRWACLTSAHNCKDSLNWNWTEICDSNTWISCIHDIVSIYIFSPPLAYVRWVMNALKKLLGTWKSHLDNGLVLSPVCCSNFLQCSII